MHTKFFNQSIDLIEKTLNIRVFPFQKENLYLLSEDDLEVLCLTIDFFKEEIVNSKDPLNKATKMAKNYIYFKNCLSLYDVLEYLINHKQDFLEYELILKYVAEEIYLVNKSHKDKNYFFFTDKGCIMLVNPFK